MPKKKKENIKQIIDKYTAPNKPINVFMIGLRGYTQNYGGWEAFAHGLFDNWHDEDIQWWAYERVDSPDKEEIIEVNNIICIRVYEGETGSSAMPKYDYHCTNLTCYLVKKLNISNPIMLHLGVRIGPLLWLNKRKYKRLGIKMAENPAGAEWRRTKWGKILQIYLYISAIMMAKSTDCMICDNEGIRDLYARMLKGKKPILEYAAYGVDVPPRVGEMPSKVQDFFDRWGIKKDEYYLVLGRFVPENNYEMMFKGFMESHTARKLLVITNYETELPKFHEHIKASTHYETDGRIIMAGTLYDSEILHYVRQYAHGYIHGHSVGGTNPGLLEAMAETDVNILYDAVFNRHVGRDATLFFDDEGSLAQCIDIVDEMSTEKIKNYGVSAREIMIKDFSWQHIVDEYSRIVKSLV
jgi:rhamnosyltransferase